MAMTKKEKRIAKEEARTKLLEWLKPGDELHIVVTHVARSGMQRSIRVFRVTVDDGRPYIHDISWAIARALEYPMDDKNGGIKVSGGGMDMGFHLIYSLGRLLFPDGGSLDHTSGTRRIQAERVKQTKETDGGYLLKHRWL